MRPANRPDVNAQTRLRILEIAKQLGFIPNPLARGLSKSATDAFGIIVPGLADTFFMPVAESIEQAARQIGYATLLHDTGRSAQAILDGITIFARYRVSGVLILGGSQEFDVEIARRLAGIPAVVVFRPAQQNLFPSVYFDHAAGARQITAHLLGLGRRRIAFVRGDDDSFAAQERLRGYLEMLTEDARPIIPEYITQGGFTIEGGMMATEQLLALAPADRPDAIFYASDTMALAGLHRLRQAGLQIPEDVAVAGYGNVVFAAISAPPLTTVRVYKQKQGLVATQLLQRMIDQSMPQPENVILESEIIIRSSTLGVEAASSTMM